MRFFTRLAVIALLSLASPAQAALDPGCGGPLYPTVKNLRTGVLVRTPYGIIFELSDYLRSHEGIMTMINHDFGPVAEFIWGGEVWITGTSESGAPSRILAVNETSSEWLKWPGVKPADPVRQFQEIISHRFPGMIGPETKFIEYNAKAEHLHDEGSNMGTYVRHDLGLDLFGFRVLLEAIEERRDLARYFGTDSVLNLEGLPRIVEAMRFMVREGYIRKFSSREERLLSRALAITSLSQFASWRPADLMGLCELLLRSRAHGQVVPTFRTLFVPPGRS